MSPRSPSSRRSAWWPALLCGAIAFLLAAARINPGMSVSVLPHGPGLTPDESFSIQQGVYLVDAAAQHGPLLWTPAVANQVFAEPRYLPDHPPLGRAAIGLAHQLLSPLIGGAEAGVFNVAAARLGSCLMFAVTVLLVARFTQRQFDTPTALIAATILMLSTRVVGHARLAALETATNLAWWAALMALLVWLSPDRPPNFRGAVIGGVFWGLLLLTKVQAVLLPPIVVVWLVVRFGYRGLLPLLIWIATGLMVWFIGWPWLWSDPWTHAMEYIGRAGEQRQILYVWYLGERFADRAVPWHYPWVMLYATLSGVATVGFAARVIHRRWTGVEVLLLWSVLFPLVVFSVPAVPVYDGVRLFLIVMPAVAVLAARGVVMLVDRVRQRSDAASVAGIPRRPSGAAVALLLAVVSVPFAVIDVVSPFAISRSGVTVGGQRGAEALGLESSYWADGLNGTFWEQVPEGAEVFVAPVSHQFQLSDLEALVPFIRQRNIRLTAFEYDSRRQRGLLLLIHRLADLRPSLRELPDGARVITEVRTGGRILARLVDTTPADPK